MVRPADSAPTRRVGIFGGTFDPPHNGHVSVARDVADALALDEVMWVPAARSPHKPDAPSSPAVRLALVRAAAEADSRFTVADLELTRPAPSYTVDTLRALIDADGGESTEFFLIMGIDQFRSFDDWRSPDEVASVASLVVMDRSGDGLEIGSGTHGSRATRVPVKRVDISSTEVRRRAARGDDVSSLVPAGVADLIGSLNLYTL